MANTMDNIGNTPLHLAAEHGYVGVMRSLLENNKLDLVLQNKESLTSFDLSVILLRKSAGNTKKKDFLGEYYVEKRGDRLSTGWFQYYIKGPISKSIDHNSTTDARDAKKSAESVLTKAQIVGLGSVLVATVTFGAAFTLPRDINEVTDISNLGRRFFCKICTIANFFAFILSFLSTMMLINSSSDEDSDRMDKQVAMSMSLFTIAARCMVWAMAFGLNVVLYPISNKTAAIVLILSGFLTAINNPFGTLQQLRGFHLEKDLLRHIPDGAGAVKQKFNRANKELLSIFIRQSFVRAPECPVDPHTFVGTIIRVQIIE